MDASTPDSHEMMHRFAERRFAKRCIADRAWGGRKVSAREGAE